MSRQLLHSYKSHVVIAALNNRAFSLVANGDTSRPCAVYELMATGTASSNQNVTNEKDGQGAKDNAPIKNRGETKNKENEEREKNAGENIAESTSEAGEIQAVCSNEMNSSIVFAVSRQDKTLSLYSISSSEQQWLNELSEGGDPGSAKKYPFAIYNLPKRARCLSFGSVESSLDSSRSCNVIIAGDLAGDVFAYPIPSENLSVEEVATMSPTNTPKRLLLGHTASMITGLQLVTSCSNQQQFILTADRDEKIRVTCFPETHFIRGFLLGHTSFVSSMDVATIDDGGSDKTRTLCVTGGGDGTVRLWDYQLCKEIGMVPVVIKKKTKEEEVYDKEDELLVYEESGNEDEADVALNDGEKQRDAVLDAETDGSDFSEDGESHTISVPTSVALGSLADYLVVARDGISSIDIHPIPPQPKNSQSSSLASLFSSDIVSLHKKQTLNCSSQPLAVRCLNDGSILVLTREPEYLLHFHHRYCDSKGMDSRLEHESITATSPYCSSLQKIAHSLTIKMPYSNMERNDDGEWKLQKKEDRKGSKIEDTNGVNPQEKEDENMEPKYKRHYWNDPERKNTAKLAARRRKKRRREEREMGSTTEK